MKPSPYQITAFAEVARLRSFSKAAVAMQVTQSSVTQHIAKLERVMGAQLFIRRREGLELTRAGRELFEIADRWRSLEQLIEEKVGSYSDLSAGSLKIVANAPRPALQVIAHFKADFPNVEIDFTLVSWDLAMRKLREREVDVAIIVEPTPLDSLTIQDIGSTRYRAYVHRDHPFANRKQISLADLEKEVIIVPEDGSLTQRIVKETSAKMGIQMRQIIKVSTFPMVKEAVLHGVGVGFMLEGAQYPSSTLTAIKVKEMARTYRNCLVTPADRSDLRVIRSFCDTAMDMASRTAQ